MNLLGLSHGLKLLRIFCDLPNRHSALRARCKLAKENLYAPIVSIATH